MCECGRRKDGGGEKERERGRKREGMSKKTGRKDEAICPDTRGKKKKKKKKAKGVRRII
jgi:hypothetical protein